MTSAAIEPVQIRALDSYARLKSHPLYGRILLGCQSTEDNRRRTQTARFAHAGFPQRPMQVAQPALAGHRSHNGLILSGRLNDETRSNKKRHE